MAGEERRFTTYHRVLNCGDFFADPWPEADVLVMGHILHDWDLDEKRTLLQKAYDALPEGGALIVYEAIIDDERPLESPSEVTQVGSIREHRRASNLIEMRAFGVQDVVVPVRFQDSAVRRVVTMICGQAIASIPEIVGGEVEVAASSFAESCPLVEGLRPLADYAGEHGIRLAIGAAAVGLTLAWAGVLLLTACGRSPQPETSPSAAPARPSILLVTLYVTDALERVGAEEAGPGAIAHKRPALHQINERRRRVRRRRSRVRNWIP